MLPAITNLPKIPGVGDLANAPEDSPRDGGQSWRLTGQLSNRLEDALDNVEKEVNAGLREVDAALRANDKMKLTASTPTPVVDPALIRAKQLIDRPQSMPHFTQPIQSKRTKNSRRNDGTISKQGYVFTDPNAKLRGVRPRNMPLSAQPGQLSKKTMESHSISCSTQAAPLAWSRFYFPDHQQGTLSLMGSNSFFQYMDVYVPENMSVEDRPYSLVAEGIPSWLKEEWLRLYYVDNMMDQPGRSASWGKVKVYDAAETLRNDFDYWADDATAERMHLEGFVKFIARLQPRSSRDERPLNKLHRGLLVFLAKQLTSASQDSADLYHAKEQRLKEKMARELMELQQRLEAQIADLLSQHEIEDATRKRVQQTMGKLNQGLRASIKSSADEKLMVSMNAQANLRAKYEKLEKEHEELQAERRQQDDVIAELRAQLQEAAGTIGTYSDGKLKLESKLEEKMEQILKLEAELDELRPLTALAEKATVYFDDLQTAQKELDEIKRATRKRTTESLEAAKEQMKHLNREFEKTQATVKAEADKQLKAMLAEQQVFE
ncbi:hypothetical protein CYMTET_27039, partial [Cymbomonas tetramitiformis]